MPLIFIFIKGKLCYLCLSNSKSSTFEFNFQYFISKFQIYALRYIYRLREASELF